MRGTHTKSEPTASLVRGGEGVIVVPRMCARCGAVLARDNVHAVCGPCARQQRGQPAAPRMPSSFWQGDGLRHALASRNMGLVVRAYRHHPAHGRLPLPQATVAPWLGVTQGQLSRIENGRNKIRELDRLERYARALVIPAELLWFDVDHEPADEVPTPTTGPSIPMITAANGSALSETIQATFAQFARRDNLCGPRPVIPLVTDELNFVRGLTASARGPDRAHLVGVLTRLAEMLGWLHQDSGDLTTAMRCTNTALDYACETGDAALISYVMMRKSNIAGDNRNPDLTIRLAMTALDRPSRLPADLRAVALRQQAHGYALAGDYDDCARALDDAHRHASVPPGESGLAPYCTPEYIEMEAAQCWVELNRPDLALQLLDTATFASWSPEFRRDQGLGLARLALAHAAAGHPEQAIAISLNAVPVAADTQSQRIAAQLWRTATVLHSAGAGGEASTLRRAIRAGIRDDHGPSNPTAKETR